METPSPLLKNTPRGLLAVVSRATIDRGQRQGGQGDPPVQSVQLEVLEAVQDDVGDRRRGLHRSEWTEVLEGAKRGQGDPSVQSVQLEGVEGVQDDAGDRRRGLHRSEWTEVLEGAKRGQGDPSVQSVQLEGVEGVQDDAGDRRPKPPPGRVHFGAR